MNVLSHVELFQMAMSAGAGVMGVGIGIGMFRSTVKQVKEDLEKIKRRQARLRGEDDGGVPLYMLRSDCKTLRHDCRMDSESKMEDVVQDLLGHTKSIKALDNFARWWMQKEGLKIEDINRILGS